MVVINLHSYMTCIINSVKTVIMVSTHHTNRESLPAYLCLALPVYVYACRPLHTERPLVFPQFESFAQVSLYPLKDTSLSTSADIARYGPLIMPNLYEVACTGTRLLIDLG